MSDTPIALRTYNEFAGIERLADFWVMRQREHVMRCTLSTHPLGWELRLTAGDLFIRSQVCKTQTQVFDTSEAWQKEAILKGWI